MTVEFLRRPSPCLGATIAREFRHKPLKRLTPRPALRPPPNPRAARVRREKRPVRSARRTRRAESPPGAPPNDRLEFALHDDVIARSPQGDVAIRERRRPTAPGSPRFARDDGGIPAPPIPLLGHDHRPEIPPQTSEKVKSAPGFATAAKASDGAGAAREEAGAFARVEPGEHVSPPEAPPDDRPQNPPQDLEKVESAPGITVVPEAASPDLVLILGQARGCRRNAPAGSNGAVERYRPLPQQATIARKFRRKPLKGLNPRPRSAGRPKRRRRPATSPRRS